MTSVDLPGITSLPLSGYLSALGLFRALAEQSEQPVTANWAADSFRINGLGRDDLVDFLDRSFRPTPIFSPWNKEGDPSLTASTRKTLNAIRDSEDSRLDGYREILQRFESGRDSIKWETLTKVQRLTWWRANVPDSGLPWLDAAFVLGVGDEPSFPPLLASGGNDGRLEFSRALHREVERLFVNEQSSRYRRGWLESLLFSTSGPALVDESLGMYDADSSGTPNSAAAGSAPSATNPWSIILTFEGLLALAGSASCRIGAARAHAMSAPFMVRSSGVGDSSGSGDASRGELWAPIWLRPTSWAELQRFLGEGRLEWNGGQARSSVDAVRAVANLGAERGVASFERFDIVKRNGLSYVASPVGRTPARRVLGIDVLAPIDDWVAIARRQSGNSTSISAAIRQLDRSYDTVVSQAGASSAFIEVLVCLYDLEQAIARSSTARGKVDPFPLGRHDNPRLPAAAWIDLLLAQEPSDSRDELIAAIGLASLRDGSSTKTNQPTPYRSMASALRGLSSEGNYLQWANSEGRRNVEAVAALQAGNNLPIEVLARRLRMKVVDLDNDDRSNYISAAYQRGEWVPLDVILRLLDGTLSVKNVLRLARGLAMLGGWDAIGRNFSDAIRDSNTESTVPGPQITAPKYGPLPDPWFSAVRLCLLNSRQAKSLLATQVEGESYVVPNANRSWGRKLAAGRAAEVGSDAATLIHRSGLSISTEILPPFSSDPSTLALTLLLALSDTSIAQLIRPLLPAEQANSDLSGKEEQ